MSAILVGKTRMGDFVHENQQMGTESGFRNTSQKWLDRTLTYEQGIELLEQGRAQTEDILCPVTKMKPEVDASGRFVFQYVDGRTFVPTEHCMSLVGAKAGTGTWLVQNLMQDKFNKKEEVVLTRDRQDAETMKKIVENGFRRLDQSKPYMWRTSKNGVLRGMLSKDYFRVDNLWLLESLKQLVPGGRLSHWKGDENTIFGNVLIPDSIRQVDNSDYGGMLSLSNCEIGRRSLETLPSIFRAICQNGCIWDREGGEAFSLVHYGKKELTQIYLMMKANLERQIPLLPQGIDRLLGTRSMNWDGGSVLPLLAEVAYEYKLSKSQASAVLTGYHQEKNVAPDTAKTLFGVINAVTRAAQEFEPEMWRKLDGIGGEISLLTNSEWDRLTSRAKQLSVKKVEEAFASMAV